MKFIYLFIKETLIPHDIEDNIIDLGFKYGTKPFLAINMALLHIECHFNKWVYQRVWKGST